MDVKLVLLTFAIFAIVFVNADFYFNPVVPKEEIIVSMGLKCVPRRTVIKIKEKQPLTAPASSSEDDVYRRSHMNFGAKDNEACEICVCSVNGKDEYCSKRPAMNVNECLVMARLSEEFNKNIPFDVDRSLSNRIRRRDLIYHNDEIPYDVTAKCYRGTSYYSSNPNANNTDLDVGSDIESVLDYDTHDICFYCICSTSGYHASCISRDPFYCDYFRYATNETNKGKARYGKLFMQERPTYFRQLSYRIRRTMDEGIFQLVDGYKQRHSRNGGATQQCVPYVSQYSTCTDENRCTGCKECTCDEDGKWNCQDVMECLGMDPRDMDDTSVERAWLTIQEGLKKKNREDSVKHGSPYAPRPQSYNTMNDALLADLDKEKLGESESEAYEAAAKGDVKSFMNMHLESLNDRFKRALPKINSTEDKHTIRFYHTVDELNEDTLKHSNDSGTITANKAPNFPLAMTRSNGLMGSNNLSHPLHIEYKSPIYDHHITDNKIDSHPNNKINEKLQKVIGNKTKELKDKDLSKLIVNELKHGIEVVGDKNSPTISNITFTRENDTLTAMAFIAGNLLNRLWNIEKDNQGSLETDVLKHEKIGDLVDLFKEPLTLRQETFLKDALEHLAGVMSKSSDGKNDIPLCAQVEKIKADLGVPKNCSEHKTLDKVSTVTDEIISNENNTHKALRTVIDNDATLAAVDKLDNVISLLRKYEEVQKHITDLKSPEEKLQEVRPQGPTFRSNAADQFLTKNETQTLNLYGTVLEKITKLLVPKKKHKNVMKTIQNHNIFKTNEDLKTKLKRIYNIDLENSTLTTKDKVVLDYLLNLRNSKCQLTDSYDSPMADGSIIQSLSEFLKVKSFVDLLKLLEPEKTSSTGVTTSKIISLRGQSETTENAVTSTSTMKTTTAHPHTTVKDNLTRTKEKLKGHLKAIISDLLELQKAAGMNVKDSNIKIAEALPCLYNILNSNKMVEDKIKYRLSKIKSVFDSIKEELKNNPETRRTYMISEPRPKSAVVWERIIQNAENVKSRRHLEYSKPITFEEIDSLMQNVYDYNNEYKNRAISKGVSPQKRLLLLKTIDIDNRIYMSILEKVKQFLEETKSLNAKMHHTINSFVDIATLNIKLDEDVLNNLYNHVNSQNRKETAKFEIYNKYQAPKKSEALKMALNDKPNAVKFSRDEIINQLIKNRVQFYLKVKELEGYEKGDNLNVRLARKILNYLETKNYSLARELFKVFVAHKQQNKTEANLSKPTLFTARPTPRSLPVALKEPLIQFEEDKGHSMGTDMISLTQALMKQLANIKNMKAD